MPELPEVETVRASLARDLIGKKVKIRLGQQRTHRAPSQDRQGLSRD
jgi:formamidopyrimidine-DNA glycosylase